MLNDRFIYFRYPTALYSLKFIHLQNCSGRMPILIVLSCINISSHFSKNFWQYFQIVKTSMMRNLEIAIRIFNFFKMRFYVGKLFSRFQADIPIHPCHKTILTPSPVFFTHHRKRNHRHRRAVHSSINFFICIFQFFSSAFEIIKCFDTTNKFHIFDRQSVLVL